MKRVLAVDDSAFVRKLIREILDSSGEFTVVDTARNGVEAMAKLEKVQPDIITLDIEMPEMNGLETLAQIMKVRPTPVVMLSSLTTKGAEISIAALGLGAVDVVAKPIAHGLPQLRDIADDLLRTLRYAATVDVSKLAKQNDAYNVSAATVIARAPRMHSDVLPVVVIAASTGGPRALRYLVSKLDTARSAFYVIVQHLPAGFTAMFAKDLNTLTPLNVREAVDGDLPMPDTILVAPGGRHSAFMKGGRLTLTDDPPLWGVRPAADITMVSAGNVFRQRGIGVVLTGMGKDGAHGLGIMKANGGRTFAEHESTSLIYGMPKAAMDSGAAQRAVPLEEMPAAIALAMEKTIAGIAA